LALEISYKKHILEFQFEAGTSRGILTNHTVSYLKITDPDNPIHFGLGECAPLEGLSIDFLPNFETILSNICAQFSKIPNLGFLDIYKFIPLSLPSIQFGFETALLDYKYGGIRKIFSNDFSEKNSPIEINGLIWMANKDIMLSRINEKINDGYKTLKLKVGAIEFKDELSLLETIRNTFSESELSIRLDANGAFLKDEALGKLEALSQYQINSIEQPIAAGQKFAMKELIKNTPIPIALDEELIGVFGAEKFKLLAFLKPRFIIIKPTLLGGFEACKEWIQYADNHNIKWWLTSALESNIGLNAIAQFAGEFNNELPQGLGTGQLYLNNIESPLKIESSKLYYRQNLSWNLGLTS
jgi:o-succinylbenzoate synthase